MTYQPPHDSASSRSILSIAAALALLSGTCALAAEIRVTPAAPGDAPRRPITEALRRASAGDIITLAPGVYHDRVMLDQAVTLRGEPGAILDGTEPLAIEWQAAGPQLPNVYIGEPASRPYAVLVREKFLAGLRFDRAQEKGDWHWQTLLRQGTPLSAFRQIQGLWVYHPEERKIYLRLPDGLSPDQAELSWIRKDGPLLHLKGTQGATIEGLTLRGGETAIQLDTQAQGNTVRQCHITSFEQTGILITGGAARNTIERNDITRGALEDWAPSLTHDRANYEIWRIHKDVGDYDRIGIHLMRAGGSNRVLGNHLHRVFDGVCVGDYTAESLKKPLPDPDHGRETEIAHNVIEDTRDSGIELGVGGIQVHVHHNVLRRTHGGLRFKVPRIGPIFIHHNEFQDGAPFNIWLSMDSSPAEGYVYLNTFTGRESALRIPLKGLPSSAPRWHFISNLIATDGGLIDPKTKAPLDYTETNNRVQPPPLPANTPQALRDLRAQGPDLSTYWHGSPLPGWDE